MCLSVSCAFGNIIYRCLKLYEIVRNMSSHLLFGYVCVSLKNNEKLDSLRLNP